MAEGGHYAGDFESKSEEDSLASKNEQVEKIYSGIALRTSDLRRSSSFLSWRRSLTLQQISTLIRPCLIAHGGTINVQFEVGEKLAIIFMYKDKFAVYRKSDGAIAVLSKAEFRDRPTALLDGSKYGVLLSDVELFLSYAVVKMDGCDSGGLKIKNNDVILILAHCKGTYVAITYRKKVLLIPSNMVQPITRKRLCIFKGMILKMSAVTDDNAKQIYKGSTYEITKSSRDLFAWCAIDGQSVPLHILTEIPPHTPDNVVETHSYENVREENSSAERPLPQPPVEDNKLPEVNPSLYREVWFHGILTRQKAEGLLKKVGDFLVRYMFSDRETCVLSCKTETGYKHFMLIEDEYSHYHTHGGEFQSIRTLIAYHYSSKVPISEDTFLLTPVANQHYDLPTTDWVYQTIPEDLDSAEFPELTEEYQNQITDETAAFGENTLGKGGETKPDKEQSTIPDSEEVRYEVPNLPAKGTEELIQCESIKQSTLVESSKAISSQLCQMEQQISDLKSQFQFIQQGFAEEHLYYELQEEETALSVIKEGQSESEIIKQSKSSSLPDTSKEFMSQLCQMEKKLSDLKSAFKSMTVSQAAEKEDAVKRKRLHDTLKPFFQVEVNKDIYDVVAGYLEPELFHEVGKMLGLSKNLRTKIEQMKTEFEERTIDLLDQWHRKKGEEATIGKLVEVLDKFHPEDMNLILEGFYEEVTRSDKRNQSQP